MPRPEFYLRYYVGHRGKFGHEFMEFEFASTGKLRYANNSNYKNDSMIRKEVTVSDAVLDEIETTAARVVVLTGEGTAFCAGADLDWMKRAAGYTRAQNEADALAISSISCSGNPVALTS